MMEKDTSSGLPDVVRGNDEPLFNIGVVSRMTDVSMATLRAWERRYKFPDSERTAGGHRLYSEKDVLRLRWVKERIDEGMQTAQAINALRHQEKIGHFSHIAKPAGVVNVVSGEPNAALEVYQKRLIAALLRKDLQTADSLLGDALAATTPEDLVLNVIGPTLSDIGTAWEQGTIDIATEHLATNYLRQRLLLWMMSAPPPRLVKPIVLACAPDEWHEGSLLILGALLRRRRWPVAYLGQSVPLPNLVGFVRELSPVLLVLVAMTEKTANELVNWQEFLPEIALAGKPLVGYGGRVYVTNPEWRTRTAGVYLGDDFKGAIELIEKLI